ncbi:hypothetical protein BH11PSE7_BH11PSE7_34610 [soil metagenome]
MNHTHTATPAPAGSLLGQSLAPYVAGHEAFAGSAWRTALHALTHGGLYREREAIEALGCEDRAAFETLRRHPGIAMLPDGSAAQGVVYELFINSLGRLHIRAAGRPRPCYSEHDAYVELGRVALSASVAAQVQALYRSYIDAEASAMHQLRSALVQLEEAGELAAALEGVIDSVEHVESVCFYVGDSFFALIDRFVNLVDAKGGRGYLPHLRGKPLATWAPVDVLIVAAFHALFISGRSVRFEEFNGSTLTARSLLARLRALYAQYVAAGCESVDQEPGLFDLARLLRRQSQQGVGQRWLRFRRIYGLNFQKNEFVSTSLASSEDSLAHIRDFAADYAALVSPRLDPQLPECLFFNQLASACLALDASGAPPPQVVTSAASGWTESLIEKIVASAVVATGSDYGMSSSLRDMSCLMKSDDTSLAAAIHALLPAHFYACFVSRGFAAMETADAGAIATSVQRRMMFNRWHFLPGNLERSLVLENRHWYYPPLVPDLAEHSDVHRAAHAKARVKYSIRSPGPDMSRPPLTILNHTYRGFYDIRVVRMDGAPYEFEHLLRARRRTLWLEAVYTVLVSYLHDSPENRFAINGFAPGSWLDLPAAQEVRPGRPSHSRLTEFT